MVPSVANCYDNYVESGLSSRSVGRSVDGNANEEYLYGTLVLSFWTKPVDLSMDFFTVAYIESIIIEMYNFCEIRFYGTSIIQL